MDSLTYLRWASEQLSTLLDENENHWKFVVFLERSGPTFFEWWSLSFIIIFQEFLQDGADVGADGFGQVVLACDHVPRGPRSSHVLLAVQVHDVRGDLKEK